MPAIAEALRKEASVATGFHRFCVVASLILREPLRLGGAVVSTWLSRVPALSGCN